MVIQNPRDGAFRPRKPEVKSIGFHFTQLLSPRQTAATILQKWLSRVDTKNFYNRVLGRPFNDPSSFPVTQEALERAQNPDLRWGVPDPDSVDDVFMGIDQKGHENHVVITGRRDGRIRLLHLEIVQDENPWRRCAELLRQYRVDVAAVEALPNYNEAHRFAREFDGRVFVVVNYRDLDDEVVLWGDRPRDRPGVRPTCDEARTPWTAVVDQYKLMSLSLSKWVAGEIETPDARMLLQRVHTSRGYQPVALCRDIFWSDLQRVALVTEESQGHEGERRLRRAVKKLGEDPHFAFAMMLADLASMRVGGRPLMLFMNSPVGQVPDDAKRPKPYMQQIMDAMPEMFHGGILDPDAASLTCGNCENFDPDRGRCTLLQWLVRAEQIKCDFYIPMPDDDADDKT